MKNSKPRALRESPSWLFITINLEFMKHSICLSATLGDWCRGCPQRVEPGTDGSIAPIWCHWKEGRGEG